MTLDAYQAEPAAFTFALLRTPTFLPNLPADTAYPIEILERIIAVGQRRQKCADHIQSLKGDGLPPRAVT
jgi:hypothetical protein